MRSTYCWLALATRAVPAGIAPLETGIGPVLEAAVGGRSPPGPTLGRDDGWGAIVVGYQRPAAWLDSIDTRAWETGNLTFDGRWVRFCCTLNAPLKEGEQWCIVCLYQRIGL
jgi:hypothetical protein